MTTRKLVTEGPFDCMLLSALLGISRDHPEIECIAAGGWSRADAIARSIRASRRADVALVVDADAISPDERRRFLESSVGEIVSSSRFHVLVIAPEIEAFLFQDPAIIETLAGRKVSELDMVRGHYEPKKVLEGLLNGRSCSEVFQENLDQLDLSAIRRLPEIQQLREFLAVPSALIAKVA